MHLIFMLSLWIICAARKWLSKPAWKYFQIPKQQPRFFALVAVLFDSNILQTCAFSFKKKTHCLYI